ncbi:uncharacterized protein LOC132644053 [Lycium barbarum]|uniref:uncharacterized protein LOC132644053 n=1 Tax=Lycium barbarum TaxID=112863 RepID=UPI00293F11F8|nr:uncharacterized protein LOC132644053 [Lycium barbarum]
MSNTNTENRKKLRYPHTVGKKSFAVIREEKQKEGPDAVTNKAIFVATGKRKPGQVYKDSYEDTIRKTAEMERIETQESEDGSQSVDAFAAVMGPDHPGHVRLYGRGVTKTVLKGKSGDSGPSLNGTDELMKQKMEEMEARMQKMQEKFEAQTEVMEQGITMNVIAQLQRLNLDLVLDPSMLRFNFRSRGEAASSNNQGVENEEMEGDDRSEDF